MILKNLDIIFISSNDANRTAPWRGISGNDSVDLCCALTWSTSLCRTAYCGTSCWYMRDSACEKRSRSWVADTRDGIVCIEAKLKVIKNRVDTSEGESTSERAK